MKSNKLENTDLDKGSPNFSRRATGYSTTVLFFFVYTKFCNKNFLH